MKSYEYGLYTLKPKQGKWYAVSHPQLNTVAVIDLDASLQYIYTKEKAFKGLDKHLTIKDLREIV